MGSHFGNRYFDGLLDDVRIWGRPLDVAEVTKLWGNGMGDLGPNAKIEVDNIAWSNQISAKLVLNQPVNDFNATSDLDLNGLSLFSITEEVDSNGTIYNLALTPDSFSPATLSVRLPLVQSVMLRVSPTLKLLRLLIFVLTEHGNQIFWFGGN